MKRLRDTLEAIGIALLFAAALWAMGQLFTGCMPLWKGTSGSGSYHNVTTTNQ